MSDKNRPDYGLDAPGVVWRMLGIGAAMLAVGLFLGTAMKRSAIARYMAPSLVSGGVAFLATGLVMIWGSRIGKLRLRDRLLALFPWRGDEKALDVGCGHGLMLLGAARRLKTGSAIGVDLWQKEDQAGNNREATMRNAVLEGVAERVTLRDGDARDLPFDDRSFDVVVSSWALHNIYDFKERRRALEEIVRVLRPGGRLLIVDIRHVREYTGHLSQLGMIEIREAGPSFLFVIPTRWLTASKPLEAA